MRTRSIRSVARWVAVTGALVLAGAPAAPLAQQAAPAPAPVATLDDAALAAFIRQRMDELDYSGAVLFARAGAPVVVAARGLADREAKTPNTVDSKFRMGSMDKMFTAVAIMQLAQQGKVSLDAPFGDYLKDYPNAAMARGVTVHQLLTHTGGVGDIFGPQFNENRLTLKTLKDYVALYGKRAGEFAPGTRWAYANYGFILLGRIIEEVSGQAYPDYVRDHIFAPAGMTGSGFEPENVAVSGRTKGYWTVNGVTGLNDSTLPWAGTSAGGGYTTVRDLLAFATALTGGVLMDADHVRLMTTKKANGSYAYGFDDLSRDGLRIYGHGGNATGMNGNFWIIGDGQAVIATLSNFDPPEQADALLTDIARRGRFLRTDGRVATILDYAPPPPTNDYRMALFRANDPDGDGKIDKAGYARVLETMAYSEQLDALFARRDANKDGLLSAEEFLAVLQ